MPSRAKQHGKMFLAALVLLGLGIVLRDRNPVGSVTESLPAEQAIAIRHTAPLSVSILRAVRPGAELIELSADVWFRFSLPASWTVREVRGAALEQLQSEPEGTDFTRWTAPPKAKVSFLTDRASHLTVHSIGSGSLLMKLTQVDLVTDVKTEKTVLLQDEQVRIY